MPKTPKKQVRKVTNRTDPYPLHKKNKKHVRLPQPYAAVRRYLEKNGWSVVVIGGTSVEERSLPYNFYFRVGFTGKKVTLPTKEKPKKVIKKR